MMRSGGIIGLPSGCRNSQRHQKRAMAIYRYNMAHLPPELKVFLKIKKINKARALDLLIQLRFLLDGKLQRGRSIEASAQPGEFLVMIIAVGRMTNWPTIPFFHRQPLVRLPCPDTPRTS